jgi:hypothetical protein
MIIMQCILTITKLEYEAGLIKQQSTSELLRFTIRHILNQVHNQPEYLILIQQQEKQVQINQEQQQLHSQVILPSTTTIITATACHQSQVSNISHRNNLGSQKMTSWKLSSLLSTQMNHHW